MPGLQRVFHNMWVLIATRMFQNSRFKPSTSLYYVIVEMSVSWQLTFNFVDDVVLGTFFNWVFDIKMGTQSFALNAILVLKFGFTCFTCFLIYFLIFSPCFPAYGSVIWSVVTSLILFCWYWCQERGLVRPQQVSTSVLQLEQGSCWFL